MKEELSVLIVDDEQPARELLQNYVGKMEELVLAGTCSSALEAKRFIESNKVDILLSDIQMDDLTGIDLLKTLKDQPITIFTTAFSEYALEGYDLDVVDYLVKPISFQRFCKAIDKAKDLIDFQNKPVMRKGSDPVESAYFFVKTNRKMVRVEYNELLFVESFGEYVKLHTSEDVHLALQTTAYMEEMLPYEKFVRIHRSYIVNMDHIRELEGNMVKVEDHILTISKRMRDNLLKRMRDRGIV